MTRIYLIRHAEAEGNIFRRAHGHYNGLLTKNGLAQAERLGSRFSHCPVTAVYASDLYRARRTAEAIASVCGKPVVIDPALREIGLGEWEDRPWGALAHENIDTMLWFDGKSDLIVKGAETREAVTERMVKALNRIAAAHGGQDIAVVSHGCAIRYVLEHVTDGHVPHLDNTAVSCLEWEDGAFKASLIGDNHHVGELSTHAKQNWWREDPDKQEDAELWFAPARLPEDMDAVMDYSREAWQSVYGTMQGFVDEMTGHAVRESAETDPRHVQFAMERERRIGLIHMRDAGRFSISDGHISLFFLDPGHRGRGLGAQLLGEAVSIARAAGKTGLSLRVYHKNKPALAFYSKMGFTTCGSEKGLFGTVLRMRMGIVVPE